MNSEPKAGRSSSVGRVDGWLRELHIKETVAKEGGQAFAGVNLGTINYAAVGKTQGECSTLEARPVQ